MRLRLRTALALVLDRWSGSRPSAGRCWPHPGRRASAHDADAPWLFAAAPAAAARRGPRRGRRRRHRRQGGRAARRAGRASARRCARSAPASPGFEPMFVRARARRPRARARVRLRARRGRRCSPRPCSPAASARGCRSRCSARRGSGFCAGLLPPARGRREVGDARRPTARVAGVAYGFLLNLWFWPFLTGTSVALSFVAGAPLPTNLQPLPGLLRGHLARASTSRGLGTAVLVLASGGPVLRALRRATRRAAFDGRVAVRAGRQPAGGA